MATSPIQSLTEEVQNGFAQFRPESPGDMTDFFKELPDFFDGLAEALSNLGSRMSDEMPVDQRVAEQVRELGGTAAGLRDVADEINGAFRAAHEAEIKRAEEPRPAEEIWDVRT